MDKLISMVDFTKEAYKKWENDNNPDCQSSARYILGTHLYALFLKQKLELWMFVPCQLVDGVWVVFEKTPEEFENFLRNSRDGGWWQEYYEYRDEFQEAKKRCLFEGFNLNIDNNLYETPFKDFYLGIYFGNQYIALFFNDSEVCKLENIEDLVKYSITLTPTAKKQIGL